MLRIHRSNCPGSLRGSEKGHFSQGLILSFGDTQVCISQFPQLHARPSSVLLAPPGSSVLLGCTQVSAHTLLTDFRDCFQAAHQVSLWTTVKTKLGVFLRVQTAIKQPIHINHLENKLSLCLSWTFLPESASSRRNKTMCVYCVTSHWPHQSQQDSNERVTHHTQTLN